MKIKFKQYKTTFNCKDQEIYLTPLNKGKEGSSNSQYKSKVN